MTIRLDHLVVPEVNDTSELGHDKSARSYDMMPTDLLTLVRHIMRDLPCDMIPRIIGHTCTDTRNTWGDDMFIHVQYAKRGWQATYGAHYVGGTLVLQCYMS